MSEPCSGVKKERQELAVVRKRLPDGLISNEGFPFTLGIYGVLNP